jgi:hypothetical protein
MPSAIERVSAAGASLPRLNLEKKVISPQKTLPQTNSEYRERPPLAKSLIVDQPKAPRVNQLSPACGKE